MNQKLQRRSLVDAEAAAAEGSRPLLPPAIDRGDEDLISVPQADRIARSAGFDLSGSSSRPRFVKNKKETRSEVINMRIKPSIHDRLKAFAWGNDLSLPDALEKLVDQHTPKLG